MVVKSFVTGTVSFTTAHSLLLYAYDTDKIVIIQIGYGIYTVMIQL